MRFGLSALAEEFKAESLASLDVASLSKRSSQVRHSHFAALGFQIVSGDEQCGQGTRCMIKRVAMMKA